MPTFGHAMEFQSSAGHAAPTHSRGPSTTQRSRAKYRETWEFRLIFAVSYPIFLGAAVVERVNPFAAPRASHRSVFEDARQAAYTSIPYAFMG